MLNLLLVLASAAPFAAQTGAPAATRPVTEATRAPKVTWVDVARVVDGDTIHVTREGKLEKLRLLCVDTEEKLGSGASSATKPQTVFGEECALWAQDFFAGLGKDGAAPRIGLAFPPGREDHRDPYGRLLCHVILPDGTDYNVLIVKLGKSPYFTKYGFSEFAHDAFVAAQKEAREKRIGIWDPATNAPKTAGTPSAARPYDKLLPWWDLRAEAVRSFETARAATPNDAFDVESKASLQEAGTRTLAGERPRLFGEIQQVFTEDDGSLTVLFRAESKDAALRVKIRKEDVAAHEPLGLAKRSEEFQQNYVWFRGPVTMDARGFRSTSASPSDWSDGREPLGPASR